MIQRSEVGLLNSIRMIIRLARIAQQVCEEGGLTMAQYRALHSAAKGGQRAYEMAQYTAVSRPAISALTNGMVKAGLIERTVSDTDGRGVVFSVTRNGFETLYNVERLLVERFEEVLGDAKDALAGLHTDALETVLDVQAEKDFGPKRGKG